MTARTTDRRPLAVWLTTAALLAAMLLRETPFSSPAFVLKLDSKRLCSTSLRICTIRSLPISW